MFSANFLLSLLLAFSASTSVLALGSQGHSYVARHHRVQHAKRGALARDDSHLATNKRALKRRSRRSCKPPSTVPAPSATPAAPLNAAGDPSDETTGSSVISNPKTEIETASTSTSKFSTRTRTISDSSVAAPTPTTDDNTETNNDDDNDNEPTSIPTTKRTSTTNAASTENAASTTNAASTKASTTSSKVATTSKAAPTTPASSGGSSGSSGGSGSGKPSNWPVATQAGAAPAATVTSAADPFLSELSKSYNNKGNALYTKTYTGDMTYYGQGLGACGDTYDDNSMTAAVSMHLFDIWPGATSAQNLNPICGPFVPGRKIINNAGQFITASAAKGDGKNSALIGGDGRINCDAVTQCHIPLTATVKHGGKSIIVKIVDRCVGCNQGDIDLTPYAFQLLADPALGRTDVEWYFNQY